MRTLVVYPYSWASGLKKPAPSCNGICGFPQQMLARMWRKRNTLPLLVGLQACKPLWKSGWRFLRKLDILLLEDPAIPLLGIYTEDVPTGKKDTCPPYVHKSLIYNSQKLERTQMSLKRGMDTGNMVHLHNGVLLSN